MGNDYYETHYIPYETIMPSIQSMKDIVSKDTSRYGKPAYQHYNFLVEYLGMPELKIKYPNEKLTIEEFERCHKLMVIACEKYLLEQEVVGNGLIN